MGEKYREIERFFKDYEEMFNSAISDPPVIDLDKLTAAYATELLAANPYGVACGRNDESLRTVIPQGYAFYRSIGTKSMNIADLDITQLDVYHYMVKVHWDSRYTKNGKDVKIEFDVIYLLQKIGENPKIFAYITGDEQGVLREHGLI